MATLLVGIAAALALALIEFGPHRTDDEQPTARMDRSAAHGIAGNFGRGLREGARRMRSVDLEGR
ncbi:hypothetical protein ACFWF7_37545 [Nocardia sp. NPDC060256]|uniref:hypothetical protein n=1 Tax=unclassified Nocardia TaxID=2637762 RepID=UPI00365280A6